MKITLQGEVPSKKNGRVMNCKTKRSFPNQRYKKWHDAVVSQLNYLLLTKKIVSFECMTVKMTVTFWHGDKVRRDSDNQLSSILDTLVDAKILSDDNWKVIPEKHIYDKYEKNKARCEIEIEPIGEKSK